MLMLFTTNLQSALPAAGPIALDLPPWPLFKFGIWAIQSLDALRDALPPPHMRAMEISFNYFRPQARASSLILSVVAMMRWSRKECMGHRATADAHAVTWCM